MPIQAVSTDIIHKKLSRDIYSNQGILLLSEGHVLKEKDIEQLLYLQITEVETLEESLPNQIEFFKQYEHIWQDNNQAHVRFKENYIKNLENTKSLFEKLKSGDPDLPSIHEFIDSFTPMLEQVITQGYLFHPLHKIKGHDEYTYRHSINVGLIGGVIGKLLNLPPDQTSLLGQMGLLHDVGKIKISDQILSKPGPLTNEEYDEVKKHTLYGYDIINSMQDVNPLIPLAALAHHERLDGSGYPHQLKEKDIPLLVQIICVADTYDAICSDRVYKPKSSFFYAVQELIKGVYANKYSPKITLPFVNYLSQSFIGYHVTLNTKEEGEIVFVHADDPLRPLIRTKNKYIDLKKNRELSITSFY